MPDAGTHEALNRENEVKVGSDRAFGVVFAVVFTIIGLLPLWSGGEVRIWSLSVAGVFLAAALAYPAILNPLNRLWFRFGLLLHKVVNPIIMALMFFVAVTPVALIMRALGKRPLKLSFEPDATSYWIVRDPPGPKPESMRNQF